MSFTPLEFDQEPLNPDVSTRLCRFIEHEARLLDRREFERWLDMFDEAGVYWVPASPQHDDPEHYVSLFYDPKATLRTRVQRLLHPQIYSQIPPSSTVRVLSNFWAVNTSEFGAQYRVESKFIMFEDRQGSPRQYYGGTYTHYLKNGNNGFICCLKRVDLTNCDHAFSALTQPF